MLRSTPPNNRRRAPSRSRPGGGPGLQSCGANRDEIALPGRGSPQLRNLLRILPSNRPLRNRRRGCSRGRTQTSPRRLIQIRFLSTVSVGWPLREPLMRFAASGESRCDRSRGPMMGLKVCSSPPERRGESLTFGGRPDRQMDRLRFSPTPAGRVGRIRPQRDIQDGIGAPTTGVLFCRQILLRRSSVGCRRPGFTTRLRSTLHSSSRRGDDARRLRERTRTQ